MLKVCWICLKLSPTYNPPPWSRCCLNKLKVDILEPLHAIHDSGRDQADGEDQATGGRSWLGPGWEIQRKCPSSLNFARIKISTHLYQTFIDPNKVGRATGFFDWPSCTMYRSTIHQLLYTVNLAPALPTSRVNMGHWKKKEKAKFANSIKIIVVIVSAMAEC